ncbi:hypothetical protein NPS53_08990 [Pseudomonas putida]|uniref:hypothetical protein n=1 Tax=Pseudomonas putida TaxID=303 RepID=UPI002363CF76|nr:hypothetical protein [Pseudomonas putida]MDD2139710.1 hypothetical protein [Pseudomonas putida]HDS1721634.1 hypothetical protein [Pseudomonas putida]
MINSLHLAERCAAKLRAFGYEAFVRCDESTDGEVVLHVPQLEDSDGMLCQQRTYLLISRMLDPAGRKGLLLLSPVSGSPVGAFCFHPDTFAPGDDGTDVEFWPAVAGDAFCWRQLETDNSQWCCGWPVDRGYEVGERIAFISALLSARAIDLPPRQASVPSAWSAIPSPELTNFRTGQ